MPRDFNIVKLSVLEFGEIVAEEVQRLKPWARIQVTLISVAPALQSPDVFGQSKFALEKFILIFFLETRVKFGSRFKKIYLRTRA